MLNIKELINIRLEELGYETYSWDVSEIDDNIVKWLVGLYTSSRNKKVIDPTEHDKTGIYENRLNTQVWVDGSTRCHNEIIQLGLSVYDDYSNGQYKLSKSLNRNNKSKLGREYYNYGMFSSRERKDIIFFESDIEKYINYHLEKWKASEKNKDLKLAKSYEDIYSGKGYTALLINNFPHYTLNVEPVKITKGSFKYPLKIERRVDIPKERFDEIVKDSLLLPFNEEGIKELKEQLTKIIMKEL